MKYNINDGWLLKNKKQNNIGLKKMEWNHQSVKLRKMCPKILFLVEISFLNENEINCRRKELKNSVGNSDWWEQD